jgi:hypothetical protein
MKPCLTQIAAVLFCLTCPSAAFTQTPQTAPPAAPQSASQLTGLITDTQGSTVSSATIILTPLGKLGEHTATSADDGSFTFTNLPASVYHLTVEAQGLALYTSAEFTLRPGASLALPAIALKEATSTSIRVVAEPEQIALAQIHLQEQQRVLGVFQNFYTSYIWDAKPMPVKQKYTMAFKSLYDPPQFFISAGIAAAEQYNGTYPGYGPGIEGYGKRYGAQLATGASDRIIGSAILPSLLHQDPRYFYQGSSSISSRTFHALSHTFTARGDNGKTQPNYSHLLGELAAAGISDLYHPAGSRGAGDTFQAFGIDLAGNLVGNLVREFLLIHLESIPTFANGKHQPAP